MSEKPIAVGDMVMVVKPRHCGCLGAIGHIFTVVKISVAKPWCDSCGHRATTEIVAAYDTDGASGLDRLKRIPPLDELEGVRSEEELHCHG